MTGTRLWRNALLGAALGGAVLAAFVWLRPEPSPAPPPTAAALPEGEPGQGAGAPTPPDGGVGVAGLARAGAVGSADAPDAGPAEPAPRASRGVEVLADSLLHGDSFRVRVRAALALGRMRKRAAGKALQAALADPHPAVRAAAARGLGRGRHRAAIGALERLEKDPEAAVRKAATRALARLRPQPQRRPKRDEPRPEPASKGGSFYVAVGAPRAPGGGVSAGLLAELHRAAQAQLRGAGVTVGTRGPGTGYHVDLTVGAVERSERGTSATVTAIIQTQRGRSMKATVRGKATVPGASDERARKDALRGATRSALRKVPGVLRTLAGG